MGLLDDLKHKAGELGDKAKEGLDAARDKAEDLVDDVKDRLGHDDTQAPLEESDDVAADGGSLNPTDVAEEDDHDPVSDADAVSSGDLDADDASDPDGFGGQPVAEGDADVPTPAQVFGSAGSPGHAVEPGVEADVDPYDSPLTESIGDAVTGSDQDPRT